MPLAMKEWIFWDDHDAKRSWRTCITGTMNREEDFWQKNLRHTDMHKWNLDQLRRVRDHEIPWTSMKMQNASNIVGVFNTYKEPTDWMDVKVWFYRFGDNEMITEAPARDFSWVKEARSARRMLVMGQESVDATNKIAVEAQEERKIRENLRKAEDWRTPPRKKTKQSEDPCDNMEWPSDEALNDLMESLEGDVIPKKIEESPKECKIKQEEDDDDEGCLMCSG